MSLQNRVTPFGEIVASGARGTFMGNRGCLHDGDRRLTGRRWTTRAWVTCLLSFRGRRRAPMTPGRYTELFFLDEATALAAGHRPCGECRRAAYLSFKACWAAGAGLVPATLTATAMDRVLHADRRGADRRQRTWSAPVDALPAGTMVVVDGVAGLAGNGAWQAWRPEGYGPPAAVAPGREVVVLTPRSTVAALQAGYRPVLHPTAAPVSRDGAP